jgi:YVTN family beta-propeller protein
MMDAYQNKPPRETPAANSPRASGRDSRFPRSVEKLPGAALLDFKQPGVTGGGGGRGARLAPARPLHYHAGMAQSHPRGIVLALAVLLTGCGGAPTQPEQTAAEIPPSSAYRIYVTNEMSGDLSIIDSATHGVIATVPLGKRPRGIHASPDGKTIYVALSGSPPAPPGVDESTLPPPDRSADGIGVFDVSQNKLVKLIPSGTDPEEFGLSQDGSLLYVANEDAALVSIVDLAKGEVVKTLPVGGEPEGVTLSPDGSLVYVTSEEEGEVYVIDTASGEIIKHFQVGARPRWVAFLPDGTKGYVSLETVGQVAVVDTVKHLLLKTVALEKGNRPMKVVMSPDGARAYVSAGRGGNVAVIDTTADEVSALIAAEGVRPWGMALSPDGATLYTANGPSNDVSVIDLATQKVTTKIAAGDSPWGVIVLKP